MELPTNLANLAAKITSAHALVGQGMRSMLEHARDVGQWLSQAKAEVERTGWGRWTRFFKAAAIPFSKRRGDEYIQTADGWAKLDKYMRENETRASQLSIRWAIRFLRGGPDSSPPTRRDRRDTDWRKNFKEAKLLNIMNAHGIKPVGGLAEVLKFLEACGMSPEEFKKLGR
jgi:hypothetical protein